MKKTLIIVISIIGAFLLGVLVIGVVGYIMVQEYHDENTFADLTISTTNQACCINADVSSKNSEDNDNPITETFIKGDTFTVDNYEFLIHDVEFEYSEIKIVSGSFSDGDNMLSEGDVITLREGESVELEVPISDASYIIKVNLDKLWWY